jgi:hypothetical protein
MARSLQFYFLENHWARKAHIYMKAFWNIAYNYGPRGSRWGRRGETIFTCVSWKKIF